MLQHTPQTVKTVVKEIMKVESSKQIRSLILCEENIHVDSSSLQPEGSAAALVQKARDEDCIWLGFEFFMNQALVFKLISSCVEPARVGNDHGGWMLEVVLLP